MSPVPRSVLEEEPSPPLFINQNLCLEERQSSIITPPASDNLQDKDFEEITCEYPPLRSRKRKRDEMWKRNILKRARNSGKEHVTYNKKKVEEKLPVFHRCGKCVNHCNENLSNSQRSNLFHSCWKLGDWQRQRDYIANHVIRDEA